MAGTPEMRGFVPPDEHESSVFPADRIGWSDEEYMRRHREMAEIPCIRGEEAFRNVIEVRSALLDLHTDTPEAFWKESVQPFQPEQVIMRYGGEDWAYAFHEQRKYGDDSYDERESSVTGIAKKIVKRVSELTREYKTKIEDASDSNRPELEEELVRSVDDVLSGIYWKEYLSGNVAVEKLQGPRGPVYFTVDGNHRIAAARLVGLKRVRGAVKEPANPALGGRMWFEMLAMLPEDQSREMQGLYDAMYPTDAAGYAEAEKGLQEARRRLPEIASTIQRRRRIRAAEDERQYQAHQELVRDVRRRYAVVDRLYSRLEESSGFKEVLHRVALDYLWNHPSGFVQRNFHKQINDQGLLEGSRGLCAHMFGIDLDGYPKRTEDEIKYRAIVAYGEEHPELDLDIG